MKLKIWLDRMLSYTGEDIFFGLKDCTSVENYYENGYPITPPFVFYTELLDNGTSSDVEIYDNDNHYYDITKTETPDFTDFSQNGTYIIIEGTPQNEYSYQMLFKMIKHNLVEILDYDEDVLIGCFKLNSEKNAVNKNLTFVKFIHGKFNHSIGVKKLDIDIEGFLSEQFNYVYLYSLKRYYYVDSVDIITTDITRLHLVEDVLNTWSVLIGNQSAFVSRYQNSDLSEVLVDERLPLEDRLTTEYRSLVDTTEDNQTNFSLTYNDGRYIVVAFSDVFSQLTNYDAIKFDNGLPTIEHRKSRQLHYYVLQSTDYEVLLRACANDDVTASFIKSVIWIPFVPDATLFKMDSNVKMYVGNEGKHLNSNVSGKAGFTTTSNASDILVSEIACGVAPYLVLKDFTFNPRVDNSFLANEPYTTYELYIVLYGWYKIENPSKLFNHRLVIYYSIDLDTGISSVFLYDMTESRLIFSSNCTLGIKMDIITTNALENTRQKQMNDLNMVLSLMGCALGGWVGVGSMSALAVGGSAISSVKSVANTIQKNGMLFERASISFGSADNSLYAPDLTCIRLTYRQLLDISDNVYADLQGYPYNNYVDPLSDLHGYIEVPEIHFNPMNELIYKDEVEEIVSLLKDGIIM